MAYDDALDRDLLFRKMKVKSENKTSLGCGKDSSQEEEESGLACHLLDFEQSCVLLECPIDLSPLSFLHPAPSQSDSNVRSLITVRKRRRHGEPREHRDVTNSIFKEVNDQVLAKGEPWYKVANLELVDVGLLDAVIVSNPSAMLGLPFLTKHPDFRGKVYATKATAEISRMMMEELVILHSEFSHGRLEHSEQKPPGLDPSLLCTLPEHVRCSSLGRCFSNRANWQPLYSAQDIRDCFIHVQKLRFGEEVNVNGSLRVSPSSSGMGIGASNWHISGARQSVSYVGASSVTTNHAIPLDLTPLANCHTLIISDVECAIKASEIGQSSQRPATKATGSFSSTSARGSLSSAGVLKSEKGGNADVAETGTPEVAAACKGAIEALRRGGSVLFPISPCDLLLELLEELGVQLAAANLKHIPIHYDSSAAEEVLAYCNTVPEWLCSTRQEKLYAGESLFSYVDLLQEERLHHSKAFSPPELKNVLQGPCVVFAAHHSLRMGPAAHLLQCWRQNPLCLLILTEGVSDKDLILAPYMPLSMQVLEIPASSRLRPSEVAPLLESIRSQVVLVPDSLQRLLEGAGNANTKVILGYKKGQSVQVPDLETELEVDMSAELAVQVQPKLVKPKKVAGAPFKADFCFRDGKVSLRTPADTTDMVLEYQCRWGQVNVGALSKALLERGMGEVSVHEDSSAAIMVEIRSPSKAWIELGPNTSHIKANESSLRLLIADAVNSVLQVM